MGPVPNPSSRRAARAMEFVDSISDLKVMLKFALKNLSGDKTHRMVVMLQKTFIKYLTKFHFSCEVFQLIQDVLSPIFNWTALASLLSVQLGAQFLTGTWVGINFYTVQKCMVGSRRGYTLYTVHRKLVEASIRSRRCLYILARCAVCRQLCQGICRLWLCPNENRTVI